LKEKIFFASLLSLFALIFTRKWNKNEKTMYQKVRVITNQIKPVRGLGCQLQNKNLLCPAFCSVPLANFPIIQKKGG